MTATFSDACSVASVVFNWDDNTSTTVNNPTSPTTASRTYAAAEVYTVTVTVTDGSGNARSQVFQYVVIYDPSAGFVTGGGWINSPAGAFVQSPSLTGKANFGFTSKYKKGMTVPTEKLVARFPRTLANLKNAIRRLPQVLIFDNEDLRTPFRQVTAFENGRLTTWKKPIPAWLDRLGSV